MLRRIDDFLIDRGFQPLADRLARWVSCYGIAAFLLTGFGLIDLCFNVIVRDWIALVSLALWLPLTLVRAHELDRQKATSVMPDDRPRYSWMRSILLLLQLAFLVPNIVTAMYEMWWGLRSLAWWMAMTALYFMACRKNPPKRREVVLPNAAPVVT